MKTKVDNVVDIEKYYGGKGCRDRCRYIAVKFGKIHPQALPPSSKRRISFEEFKERMGVFTGDLTHRLRLCFALLDLKSDGVRPAAGQWCLLGR